MDQRSLYLVRQAVSAVFKRWRMVMLVFLAVVVPFNTVNALRKPEYTASAKVLLTRERAYAEISPIEGVRAVDRLPNESIVNSEVQLIRSGDLMRRVRAALEEQAGGDPADFSGIPTPQALENGVRVVRKPQSNVLEIAYAHSDPDMAINVVNTILDLYIDYHIELHNVPGAYEFFDRETQLAKEAFVHADHALERFDSTHGLTSIATEKDQLLRQRAQLEADLRRTEARVAELTTKVAAIEAELEYIPEQEATQVEMVPNPLITYLKQNLARLEMERERLLQLYTPQHRLVMDIESEVAGIKNQIASQESTVVGRKRMATTPVRVRLEESLLGAQAELGALEARRALLAERISDYEGKIRVMHGKHYEVMRLRRDRQEKKDTYEALLQKLNLLKVSNAMDKAGISNISILEAAVGPLVPQRSFKLMTLILTVLVALLVSVSAAVVTEMLNPVLNSELDVRYHLGLPVLAEIPLSGNGNGNGHNGNANNAYGNGNGRHGRNGNGGNGRNGNGGRA